MLANLAQCLQLAIAVPSFAARLQHITEDCLTYTDEAVQSQAAATLKQFGAIVYQQEGVASGAGSATQLMLTRGSISGAAAGCPGWDPGTCRAVRQTPRTTITHHMVDGAICLRWARCRCTSSAPSTARSADQA